MFKITVMYKDERQRLTAQIEEWNSNRLDLFALSQPNEVRKMIYKSSATADPDVAKCRITGSK